MSKSTERAAALERAIEDLRQAEAGEVPDLADAPIIDDWLIVDLDGALAMVGLVTGHPTLPDSIVMTSVLVGINEQAGWARTVSRWYRLGRRAGDDIVH
jgi:hypothetical protein